jgi:hypothetical protein
MLEPGRDNPFQHRPEVRGQKGEARRGDWQQIRPAVGSRSGQAILNQLATWLLGDLYRLGCFGGDMKSEVVQYVVEDMPGPEAGSPYALGAVPGAGNPRLDAGGRNRGLAGRDFSYLFRADRDPRRVPFLVGGEKECYVALLPLDKDHRNMLMRMSGGVIAADGAPDVLDYIVGNTVVDFGLWHRPETKAANGERRMANGKGQGPAAARAPWQQIRPAVGNWSGQAILNQIKTDFHALPEFWDALVFECLAENGFNTPDSDEANGSTGQWGNGPEGN